MIGRKKKEPERDPYPGRGDGRWITLVNGSRVRHVCHLPGGARLGGVFECPDCRQVWKYTHDNIASCFWVHAGWLKKLAYYYTRRA